MGTGLLHPQGSGPAMYGEGVIVQVKRHQPVHIERKINMNHHDRTDGVLVIGVGNEFRGDDGLGPRVVRRLKTDPKFEAVSFIELHGEGSALIEAWKRYSHVILIDAFASDAESGTVHFIDAANNPVPPGTFRYSSHSFGVAEAIEISRRLEMLPPHFVVGGIEGVDWGHGQYLSRSVSDNIPSLIDGIRTHILAFHRMLISSPTEAGIPICGEG